MVLSSAAAVSNGTSGRSATAGDDTPGDVSPDPMASHTSHFWIPVPWKSGAATPTMVTGRPLIRSTRPTTLSSLLNRRLQ